MNFKFTHNNINVFDLEKSLKFYEEALGLKEVRRYNEPNGEFTLAYLGDGKTEHELELTYLTDRKESYNLGDNEIHLAVFTDDFDGAFKKHSDMGCVCYENKKMGIYFISDPDGYWTEILPERNK
ncbi:MAG: VOC family protein [Clostridium sp.]|nr:VOC family protein [Clostridium sp.]